MKSRCLLLFCWLSAFGMLSAGNLGLKNPQFLVERVQWLYQNSPDKLDLLFRAELVASEAELMNQMGFKLGTQTLFEIDLFKKKELLLRHPWVQTARFQKRFPNTLAIHLLWKEPVAILQTGRGEFFYLDASSQLIEEVKGPQSGDFPILMGFLGATEQQAVDSRLKGALSLLSDWEKQGLGRISPVYSIQWDAWLGYRLLASYRIRGQREPNRVLVDFGQGSLSEELTQKIFRVRTVIDYLEAKSLPVHHISADAGKKIVVKTVAGS